jgi:hypothetical protein
MSVWPHLMNYVCHCFPISFGNKIEINLMMDFVVLSVVLLRWVWCSSQCQIWMEIHVMKRRSYPNSKGLYHVQYITFSKLVIWRLCSDDVHVHVFHFQTNNSLNSGILLYTCVYMYNNTYILTDFWKFLIQYCVPLLFL